MRRIIAYCHNLDNVIISLHSKVNHVKPFVLNLPRFCDYVQEFKFQSSKTSKLKATSNLKSKHTTFNLKLQTSKLKHPTSNRNWNPLSFFSRFSTLSAFKLIQFQNGNKNAFNWRISMGVQLMDVLEANIKLVNWLMESEN
jgi:hypothetical protein